MESTVDFKLDIIPYKLSYLTNYEILTCGTIPLEANVGCGLLCGVVTTQLKVNEILDSKKTQIV